MLLHPQPCRSPALLQQMHPSLWLYFHPASSCCLKCVHSAFLCCHVALACPCCCCTCIQTFDPYTATEDEKTAMKAAISALLPSNPTPLPAEALMQGAGTGTWQVLYAPHIHDSSLMAALK